MYDGFEEQKVGINTRNGATILSQGEDIFERPPTSYKKKKADDIDEKSDTESYGIGADHVINAQGGQGHQTGRSAKFVDDTNRLR